MGLLPLNGVRVTDFAKFVVPTAPTFRRVPFKEKPLAEIGSLKRREFLFKATIDMVVILYIHKNWGAHSSAPHAQDLHKYIPYMLTIRLPYMLIIRLPYMLTIRLPYTLKLSAYLIY